MDFLHVLDSVCVENYDNGRRFTNRKRLDAIQALLCGSAYRLVSDAGLFHLYGKREIVTGDQILLVSTHVDCYPDITKCISTRTSDAMLHGTYDNAVTNAAAVCLMLENDISDDVFFAFTGDEEFNARGAEDLMTYLDQRRTVCRCIVLDVTDMGWNEEADFTVENNFFGHSFGSAVVALAEQTGHSWRFVPSDPDAVPPYVCTRRLIDGEADEDESWVYDENDIECFSLCLPCRGEMHNNRGVDIRIKCCEAYLDALRCLLKGLV